MSTTADVATESPARHTTISRLTDWTPRRPTVTALVVASVGMVVLVLRRPTAITDPGLYAEDGVIFLLESLRNGAGAIFHPYNGYLHLLPRLVAGGSSVLPLGWTPIVFSLSTAAASVGAAGMVLSKRFERLMPAYVTRLGLFALLLLIPRLTEVHLALNSVLWWCGIALLLTALADDPTTRAGRIGEIVLVAIAVLSGLGGVVLAPIAAARWLRTRSRQSLFVVATWWAGGLIQLAVYATQDRENGSVPIGTPLARAAIEKTFGALMLGRRAVDEHWRAGTPTVVLLGLGIIAIVWAAIAISGMSWLDWAPIGWTIAAATTAGFLALGPAAALLPDRYTVLPIGALLIGLLSARPTVRVLLAAKVAIVVVVVALRVTDFVVPQRPSTEWDHSVDCLDDVARQCVIPLNPDGWTLTLPPQMR